MPKYKPPFSEFKKLVYNIGGQLGTANGRCTASRATSASTAWRTAGCANLDEANCVETSTQWCKWDGGFEARYNDPKLDWKKYYSMAKNISDAGLSVQSACGNKTTPEKMTATFNATGCPNTANINAQAGGQPRLRQQC